MERNNPINQSFEGSHFHHLHIINNHAIGVYIPKTLHKSIFHSAKTWEGMKEINNAALLWLCEQAEINGEPFDHELGNYSFREGFKLERASPGNLERIANIGKYGESFDDVLGRLLTYWETGEKEE